MNPAADVVVGIPLQQHDREDGVGKGTGGKVVFMVFAVMFFLKMSS